MVIVLQIYHERDCHCSPNSGQSVEQAGGRLTQPSSAVRDTAAQAARACSTGGTGRWTPNHCRYLLSYSIAQAAHLHNAQVGET